MTIFISYPMYFDALRTNINSKNEKKVSLTGHFRLKTERVTSGWERKRKKIIFEMV